MKNATPAPVRQTWIDLTRILAICLVVAIHTTDYFVRSGNYSPGGAWWMATGINLASIVAVPWFLIISGLLASRQRAAKYPDVIKKTWFRLGIPLIAWTVITYTWQHLYWSHPFRWSEFVSHLYLVDIYHLYYLVILIGLYLLYPLVAIWIRRLTLSARLWIWALLAAVALLCKFAAEQDMVLLTIWNTWALYLPYFLMGILLRHHSHKPRIKLAVIALLLCLLLWALNMMLFSTYFEIWQVVFSNYLTIGGMSLGITSFLVLYHLRNHLDRLTNLPRLGNVIAQLGMATYGVYLVHPIVMDILDRHAGMNIHTYPGHLAIYTLHFLGLVVGVSYLAILLARRIAPLRVILGEPWKKPKPVP